MPEIYRTAPLDAPAELAALAVHCSDPRYQPHFQEFLSKGLGLQRYGLIAVPGGPQPLTLLDYLPKFSWTGWRWVTFMMDLSQPSRVILINHHDCRWYHDARFGHDPAQIEKRQIRDLQQVRREMLDRFGARRVELYYARLDSNRVAFEAVS
jgi:hypothetical protein